MSVGAPLAPTDVHTPDERVRWWPPVARATGIAALLGASTIHVRVMPEHFEEWWVAGLTFAVLALLEASMAVALIVRPGRWLYLAAIWASQTTIGLWVLTRTVGLPFGPNPFVAEPVGRADLVATTLEVTTWLVFTPLFLRGEASVYRWRPVRLPVAIALVLVTAATGFGVLGPIGHEPGHDSLTGPITPVDGHSALPRWTPPARASAGETVGLVIGQLRNDSDRDVAVIAAQLIPALEPGKPEPTRFWLMAPNAARPGVAVPLSVLRRTGIPLPGFIPVEPYSRTGGAPLLVLEVTAPDRGEIVISAYRLTYEAGGRTFHSPYATFARLVVR